MSDPIFVFFVSFRPTHAALQARYLDGHEIQAYYDTVLNITWLRDANYARTSGASINGRMNWNQAAAWAASLSFTNPLTNQTYNNWRLPAVKPVNGVSFNYAYSDNGSTDSGYNISAPGSAYPGATGSEMAHIFYNTLGNKAICGLPGGCLYQPGWGLSNVGPFTNLQAYILYWSGTEHAPNTGGAWVFDFYDGYQHHVFPKDGLAWAVSPGDVGAVTPHPRGEERRPAARRELLQPG